MWAPIRRILRSSRRRRKMSDFMEAPERGALMLVRFIAVAIIGLSVLEIGLYLAESHMHHEPINVFHSAVLAAPLVLGMVLLVKARAVAEWISNRFDE